MLRRRLTEEKVQEPSLKHSGVQGLGLEGAWGIEWDRVVWSVKLGADDASGLDMNEDVVDFFEVSEEAVGIIRLRHPGVGIHPLECPLHTCNILSLTPQSPL